MKYQVTIKFKGQTVRDTVEFNGSASRSPQGQLEAFRKAQEKRYAKYGAEIEVEEIRESAPRRA